MEEDEIIFSFDKNSAMSESSNLPATMESGEQVHSNYTHVVVVVWLFVMLILTNSYTASLSYLLAINRLQPNVDIKWLIDINAIIGSYSDYVWRYLKDMFGFKPENIKNVTTAYDYIVEFESSNISSAFLESPYEYAFSNKYCYSYAVPVFQIGSPIAKYVPETILTLSENGSIKELHQKWFALSPGCKAAEDNDASYSLNWKSFWGLFLFSAATSIICYLIFVAEKSYNHYRERRGSNIIRMLNYRDAKRKLDKLLISFSPRRKLTTAEIRDPADQNELSAEGMSSDQIEFDIP